MNCSKYKYFEKLKQKLYYRNYYYTVTKKKLQKQNVKITNYDYDESSNDSLKDTELFVSNLRVRIDTSKKFIVEFKFIYIF
jgi:hypothetical protein